MLFSDLCKKYNVDYVGYLYENIDIPDEWGRGGVSYEFDGNNHTWKKNNNKDYIIFDGSDYYLHHLESPENPPSVFEDLITEGRRYRT